jgi:hypothetical protein
MPNVNHSNTNRYTDTLSLFRFHLLPDLKKNTFWKPAVLPSSGKEAPNLVDPLDQAILSQWASQKHTFLLTYVPEHRSIAIFPVTTH